MEATAEVQADAVPLALLRAVQVPAVLALPRAVQVLGALIPAVLVLLHDVTLGGDVLTLVQEVVTVASLTIIPAIARNSKTWILGLYLLP